MLNRLLAKIVLSVIIVASYVVGTNVYLSSTQVNKTEQMVGQLANNSYPQTEHLLTNNVYAIGWGIVALSILLLFWGDFKSMLRSIGKYLGVLMLGIALLGSTGCRKPFEPVKLETIGSNEEAFLLPLIGNGEKQSSSSNEEYLKKNLVYTKQVQIPQQWVQEGYETMGYNGSWRDAGLLIKVDKSPVTREWTADVTTGTSNKNEAVWVMTSDQVEFSTGWTITARISSRDDAVKFLHNYPNGSLHKVLDSEVRGKLQADFGLEVTDLPMDELRKNATPHITKVVKQITEFFKARGIDITNLGITGGFVYKDKTILETMVKVFNAEQEKTMAVAATNAQRERNQAVILEAQGKADALLKTKKAEADGIKLVADAKGYEIEQAKKDLASYMQLKQLELQKELLLKWDGAYPRYFIGGGSGQTPNMLLSLPSVEPEHPKK